MQTNKFKLTTVALAFLLTLSPISYAVDREELAEEMEDMIKDAHEESEDLKEPLKESTKDTENVEKNVKDDDEDTSD